MTGPGCGLSQLIALNGTVPVVRPIGGLADTVFDRDYSARHPGDRNGYVFHQDDNPALESAMARAIGLWFSYPGEFRHLMLNGMRHDHSRAWPGQHYLNIYDHIRHKEDPCAPGTRQVREPEPWACGHRPGQE